ncbi:MAG: hypothetical protein ACLPVW_16100 [Terriglobales bacterium]
MKWIAAVFVLFVASGCMAQQMDEKNDPALQLTFYTPHRINISKERQGSNLLRSVWVVSPYIAERYDHTNKWFGIFVELHGNKQILNTGKGGLLFTVDGKQIAASPTILAHSRREPSCALTRCTVAWYIEPRTLSEQSALVEFVKTVANGHEVYATLFPGENGSGQRFTAKLTDEQLLGFHEAQQYYESLTLVKKVSQQTETQ